jgi:hypothetical protein
MSTASLLPPDIKLQIAGSRFAFGDPDFRGLYAWYDVNDPETVILLLRMELRDMAWEGALSTGVALAEQLREAGLLTEPPLSRSKYLDDLRKLSDEIGGEYLPDYIRRVRRELEDAAISVREGRE